MKQLLKKYPNGFCFISECKCMKSYRTLLFFVLLAAGLQAQPQLVSVEAPTLAFRNGLFEINVQLLTSAENPYNYSDVRLIGVFFSPDGNSVIQDGFHYQHFTNENGLLIPSGDPYWKIRFSPRQAGEWSFQLMVSDNQGNDLSENFTFHCTESEERSFLSFEAGEAYLKNESGVSVFLVGENIAWAEYQSGTDHMHTFMSSLSESGANFAKLMMVPWSYSIEWGDGGFMNYSNRQDRAFMVDSIFRMSKNLGLYLQLAFSIHDELRDGFAGEDWLSNPYNVMNGGPCTEPYEFFTLLAAKEGFRNRLRYISARWGYEAGLFAWELFSEADNFPLYSTYKEEIAQWANEMTTSMHEFDPNQHPVSVGFALTTSDPEVWNQQGIGFSQLHYYTNRPDIEGEVFCINDVYRRSFRKPVMVGEYGIGHVMDSVIAQDPQGWAMHNGLWTSALSGSFASVVPWYWDAYIHNLNLYHHFTGISAFMKDENFQNEYYEQRHLDAQTSTHSDFTVVPDYNSLSVKSPSTNFILQATGLLTPSGDSLASLLHGPLSMFSHLRNPPVFHGKWQQESLMTLMCGALVNNGVLQVQVDGTVRYEQEVAAGSQIQLVIPAGTHGIRLDNTGITTQSAIEIEEILFEDYLPEMRAFGLLNPAHGLIWVHNPLNNWQWYRQNDQAPEPVDGQIILPYSSGLYQVDFYSTTDGLLTNNFQIEASSNGLVVPVSGLSTDLALKVSFLNELNEPSPVSQQSLTVFPNPADNDVHFVLQETDQTPLLLEITDLTGRLVFRKTAIASEAHNHLIWLTNNTNTRSGIYFYRLLCREKCFTGKIIIE